MGLLRSLLGNAVKSAQISEAAQTLADSLRTHPGDWTFDDYELHNRKNDAKIWVANEDYGLKIVYAGGRWVPNGAERAVIWDAAKTLLDAKGHTTARRLASQLET